MSVIDTVRRALGVPDIQLRGLSPAERALGRSVYADSVPYDRIVMTTLNLGGAVTLMLDEVGMTPIYTINWVEGFRTIFSPVDRSATFIHELVHT